MTNNRRNRVSNQEVETKEPEVKSVLSDDEKKNVVGEHSDFPEVYKLRGGFKIKVKVDETDDDGNATGKKVVLYSRGYEDNDDKAKDYSKESEPFEYYKAPGLVSALRLSGAKLSDDQIQFLNEALSGSKETGKAVAEIVEIYNDSLKQSAQSAQYSKILNRETPLTDENRDNAMASIVRNFVKSAGVSPEIAIGILKGVEHSPLSADYTLARYLANKGKR